MTPQEIAKDKRLRKNYGWTLEMYNALFALQGGVCAICGKPPKTMPLNVDHVHFHVEATYDPTTRFWMGVVKECPVVRSWAETKKRAIQLTRDKFLPYSVRGLLCAGRHRGCNRLLGRIDNREWLEKALVYLKDPPARKIHQI